MRYDVNHSMTGVSKANFRVPAFFVLCLLFLVVLPACREHPGRPTPPPPDLSRCTRVEIQYYPSTLEAIYVDPHEQSLLSPEERAYLESLKTIVVDDPERIKAFAHDLKFGSYRGTGYRLWKRHIADVVCYHNGERLMSFEDYVLDIRTEHGHWFHYDKRSVGVSKLTPQLRPFDLRASCARHLSECHSDLRLFLDDKGKEYQPSKWCDAIVRVLRADDYTTEEIMRPFKCPGGGEGKCHYALNPHCEPNSPPDTVLLFETKGGWNQHGGPELFTFDNHEPKGGCVLLNDGTVKFIRTKEELQQLRWK